MSNSRPQNLQWI